MPPFQGLIAPSAETQGVALGWLVCGPLALSDRLRTEWMTDSSNKSESGFSPASSVQAGEAVSLSARTRGLGREATSASPLNRRLESLHANGHTLRMSTKQIVQDLLQKLPENVSLHDVAQEIEFVAGVRQGLAEIERGERIPIEDIERELPSWVIR